jgi:hypothetical protein
MALTTDSGYREAAARGEFLRWFKTAARTTVALVPYSLIDVAGSPGAGVLAGTSTAAGVVPTDATAGCPSISAFSGDTGYVDGIEIGNSVLARIEVYDLLFKAGAYAFNANTTLASQPSYASRVPGGTNFGGTEIWLEVVTATTTAQTITVTYTNQNGTTGRTTGAVTGLPTGSAVGRMQRLNLQSGDSGVQKIESVASTGMTVGTFNVLVLRRLAGGRIRVANDLVNYGPDLVRIPTVTDDAALFFVVTADSTSSGTCEAVVKVING